MQTSFDNSSDIGPVEIGPIPRPPQFGRWVRVNEAPLPTGSQAKTWKCRKTAETITIDGRLDKAVWRDAEWSEPFGLIHDGGKTPLETRISLLWDDEYLYAAFRIEDPDIRASMTGFNDHIYLRDEDIEIFFEGEGYYYEMGLNAINTSYQICWTWVEPLVREQRFDQLEELLKKPDVLYYVAREGESLGRHADLSYQLPGLRHAVMIDGTLNCPGVRDREWTVELALPWSGLASFAPNRNMPPHPGESFRMTAYRAHHDRENRKVKGWTWSVMGNDNIHIPERWNSIVFVDETE